jgi:hypothetical protein
MAIIDILAIQPQVISRDLRSKYLLLAGAPKIGKTEFCTMAPDALVLAFEIGTNARPGAMIQKIDTWSTFKLVLRQLEKPEAKEKFSTICIDTVAIAYDLCEQFICAQNGVQKIGDIPYGGGYAALSKEFDSALRKITMMGYGLIMTCHLKENADEDGKIVGYKPDLNNRCLKIVNGLVDIIGVITQTWNEQGESQRWIQTRSTPTIVAGSRYKYLAPRIPFGYHEFLDALGKAIDKEQENGAVVTDTAPIDTFEKLDYKAIRAEASDLWQQLVERDPENAPIILKKVEMIFGRPIKLSEITEDQVDLFNLVVLDMKDMLND